MRLSVFLSLLLFNNLNFLLMLFLFVFMFLLFLILLCLLFLLSYYGLFLLWLKFHFLLYHLFHAVVHVLDEVDLRTAESPLVRDIIDMVVCLCVLPMGSSDLHEVFVCNRFEGFFLLTQEG